LAKDLAALAEARGLTLDTLEGAGVYVDWEQENAHDFPPGSHPVWFPYRNLTGVWYERQRRWIDNDSKPKYLSPPNGKAHLYNPGLAGPGSDPIYFAEGEIDTLTLIESGRDAVGVSGAGAFDIRWADLWQYSTVVIVFDGDQTGQDFAAKLAGLFPPENVHVWTPPPGEDINSLYQRDALNVLEEWELKRGIKPPDRE